jgi:hypothetical protein
MSNENLLPYTSTTIKDEILEYSQKVGLIIYSTIITRANIAFTTKSLAKAL